MKSETEVPRQDFIVGLNQTKKAIRTGIAKVIYLADDAERRVREPVVSMCEENGMAITQGFTMEQLGKMCGIEVGCAVCAVKNAPEK